MRRITNDLDRILALISAVIDGIENEKRGRPRKAREGRPRRYPPGLFVILAITAGYLGITMHALHGLLVNGKITLPGRYEGMIPGRRTMERRTRPSDREFRLILQRLQRKVPGFISMARDGTLVIDSSELRSVKDDHLARWGFSSKTDEFFKGYKGHGIVSCNGVPLTCISVTTANVHDVNMALPLAKEVQNARGHRSSFFVGDSAYDSKKVFMGLISIGAEPVVTLNPRKDGKEPTGIRAEVARNLADPFVKALLIHRSVIERFFSFLKAMFRVDPIPWWLRGVRKLRRRMIYITCAIWAIQLANLFDAKPLLAWRF